VVALAKQRSASGKARAEQAARLGAEAVSEPRVDVSLLLAREAVNLDRSPQTESTLLRSPSALATITLPITVRPQLVPAPARRNRDRHGVSAARWPRRPLA
jgi:hypothetical protein